MALIGPIGKIPTEDPGAVRQEEESMSDEQAADLKRSHSEVRTASTQTEDRGGVTFVGMVVGVALAVVISVAIWLVATGRLSP